MKRLAALLLLLLLASTAFAQSDTKSTEIAPQTPATKTMQRLLQTMANVYRGKVSLYARDLKTGQTVELNADAVVQTASVIKLAVFVEAFEQVKAGKKKLADTLILKQTDKVPGSGVLQFMRAPLTLTLEDVLVLMIIQSDNTATNLAIDDLGLANINQRIVSLGLKNTYLYKKVYKPAEGPVPADQKTYGLGKTTAREMASLIESIQRCDLGDQTLCARMMEIMKNQQYRNMIPRYVEPSVDTSETPSAVADKIGQLDDVRNDVAIVFTRSGPIVISAFTNHNSDQRWSPENEAELLIARMAKVIVDTWAPQGLGSAH